MVNKIMIAIIGCGKMGYALLHAMMQSGKFKASEIIVAEKNLEQLALVKENFAVSIAENSAAALKKAAVVVIAVKPQGMQQVIEEIGGSAAGKLIISIAAGIKISFFERQLPKARIVRVMPNICCLAQAMAGAFAAGGKATDADKQLVKKIFSSAGLLVEVKEEQLDAVTALSGSGPAFFAFFADALAKGAMKNGLSEKEAKALVAQTMAGTAKMLQSSEMDAPELIKSVASPGGTTEAGLKILQEKNVAAALSAAIDAAVKRSKELSKAE